MNDALCTELLAFAQQLQPVRPRRRIIVGPELWPPMSYQVDSDSGVTVIGAGLVERMKQQARVPESWHVQQVMGVEIEPFGSRADHGVLIHHAVRQLIGGRRP